MTQLSLFENETLSLTPETCVASLNSDCKAALRVMVDNGLMVDSIVTDPPYELGFMGKSWDSTGIAYDKELWELCLKVLKPGGHLLAFSGSRTYHRMACAIEDAGFEIRDQIMWVYGQGFPKSLNVSKAIDKMAGAEREVLGYESTHINRPKTENWKKSDAPMNHGTFKVEGKQGGQLSAVTSPATDAAKKWEGWGSQLKPAHEPVVMARKPLDKGLNIAENVLKHGTGAINVDGCRVGTDQIKSSGEVSNGWREKEGRGDRQAPNPTINTGRFPANLIHDGSEEVMEEFAKYGERKSGTGDKGTRKVKDNFVYSNGLGFTDKPSMGGDTGTAARFFKETPFTEADIAHEPVVMARKPLDKGLNIAENVLKHGTGAINVDGCRVDFLNGETTELINKGATKMGGCFGNGASVLNKETTGRFPANLIHDGSDEVMEEFAKYGERKSGNRKAGDYEKNSEHIGSYGGLPELQGSSGSAARFFKETPFTEADIAHEPVVMARKPMEKGLNIAQNVLKHGTGAINVDGCRVGSEQLNNPIYGNGGDLMRKSKGHEMEWDGSYKTATGRFPANLIHDGSDEVISAFPETHSHGGGKATHGGSFGSGNDVTDKTAMERFKNDKGSAARFFYSAKASKKDRCGSKHPTVKPIALMRYLCRLITPPNGIILDPFAGTGTTGQAAQEEGFNAILIERDKDYFQDIIRRLYDQG